MITLSVDSETHKRENNVYYPQKMRKMHQYVQQE